MTNLLLTGFEPFGGYSVNPSQMIAIELDGKEFSRIKIIGKVISLRFHNIKREIIEIIDKYEPEIILNLGQASRPALSIEKVAINLATADHSAYNCGSKPRDEILEPTGPVAYFSTLPIRILVQLLKENHVPCFISYSAGTFGCNQIMYHSLHHIHNKNIHQETQAGFIHLPLLPEQVLKNPSTASMDYNTMRQSIELIISKMDKMIP